ncbi:hybrid signal transduction histidine kinase K [Acrasis kona]|uniref:Hybrid signal transduction histidine kinase K n=1 Tax=Acrasis kona TaxID=1008807 RepID=A0AAW2ZH63_9EUKA
MPINYQGQIKGILYLTNDLISDCFLPERVLILSVLAAQLAISLEHSRYYEYKVAHLQKLNSVERKRAQEEEANRKKQEEFVDRICHEIRNPIQGIMGNCEIIRHTLQQLTGESTVHQTIDSCVNNIFACGRYQRIICDDVLTLSKLELGKIVLNPSPCSLHHIINDVITMNQAEADRKNLSLTCQINAPLDTVVVLDECRTTMVFMNLITNAIKFTGQGSVTVTCDFINHDESQSTSRPLLRFSVKDTGCGMDQEETKNIFNRFMQATQRVYSEYGGSGLGLFISKAIVDLLGGDITVDSTKHVGTCFTFTCLYEEISDAEKQLFWTEKKSGIDDRAVENDIVQVKQRSQLNVMVVEDNIINQRVVVKMVVKIGCQTFAANHGLEAVKLFDEKNGDFDLILMDVTMPVMDGYQATRTIRQIESEMNKKQRTLIVGLSGNVRPEYHSMGKDSGMDLFLNKPCTYRDIEKVIESIF